MVMLPYLVNMLFVDSQPPEEGALRRVIHRSTLLAATDPQAALEAAVEEARKLLPDDGRRYELAGNSYEVVTLHTLLGCIEAWSTALDAKFGPKPAKPAEPREDTRLGRLLVRLGFKPEVCDWERGRLFVFRPQFRGRHFELSRTAGDGLPALVTPWFMLYL